MMHFSTVMWCLMPLIFLAKYSDAAVLTENGVVTKTGEVPAEAPVPPDETGTNAGECSQCLLGFCTGTTNANAGYEFNQLHDDIDEVTYAGIFQSQEDMNIDSAEEPCSEEWDMDTPEGKQKVAVTLFKSETSQAVQQLRFAAPWWGWYDNDKCCPAYHHYSYITFIWIGGVQWWAVHPYWKKRYMWLSHAHCLPGGICSCNCRPRYIRRWVLLTTWHIYNNINPWAFFWAPKRWHWIWWPAYCICEV